MHSTGPKDQHNDYPCHDYDKAEIIAGQTSSDTKQEASQHQSDHGVLRRWMKILGHQDMPMPK